MNNGFNSKLPILKRMEKRKKKDKECKRKAYLATLPKICI